MTLTAVGDAVRRVGGQVDRAITCVSSPRALIALEAQGLDLERQHESAPEQDILHLRDFVPWLPYSGRRLRRRPLPTMQAQALTYQLSPLLFSGGALLHLNCHDALVGKLKQIGSQLVVLLEESLERPARVEDLSVLGDGIGIPLSDPHQEVGSLDPLRDLLIT